MVKTTVAALAALWALAAPAQALETSGSGDPAAAFADKLIMDFDPFVPPDAPIHLENGETATLRDFRGKVVLATLWATWCGPCRVEMPELEDLSARIDDDRLVVFPVSLDDSIVESAPQQAIRKVRAYYDKGGFAHLPIAIDERRMNGAAFYGGDPVQTPTTFVLDHSGRVIAVAPGAGRDWTSPEAEAWLRGLLAAAEREKG